MPHYKGLIPLHTESQYEELRRRSRSIRHVHKFARNRNVGSVAIEDIWEAGGVWPGHATVAPQAVRIAAGGNLLDTLLGNGAQTVRVEGLDADFQEVTADLECNGILASAPSTQTFVKVFRAYVTASGSAGGAQGTITIESADGTLTWIAMPSPDSQSQVSFFPIPAGHYGAVHSFAVSVRSQNPGATVWMMRRDNINSETRGPARAIRVYGGLNDLALERRFSLPELFPEHTLLWWQGLSEQGSCDISVDYEIELLQVS